MTGELTIGRLARAAGVNVETVRYYQRRRLLAVPPRPAGGVRRYPPAAVARLRFIKRAQELGFTLAEIGRLVSLSEPQSCGKARSLAASKLDLVNARLADLERMRGVLEALIARCDAAAGNMACPIIETLAREVPAKRVTPQAPRSL